GRLPAESESQRDLPALAERALRLDAHDDPLARLDPGDERAPRLEGHHRPRELVVQLEDLTGALDRDGLGLGVSAAIHREREGGREGAVEGAGPPAADRALGAHDLHDLVVLEGGERLADDG